MKNFSFIPTFVFILITCCTHFLCVQVKAQSVTKRLAADKVENRSIKLDGELSEEAWQKADLASGFQLNFPVDTMQASANTEVKVLYDQNFIYIGAVCYENSGKDYVITSLRRDFSWGQNDNFSVYIDPFNDGLNGFGFGISPYGVQIEGLIFEGDNVDDTWDNKWYSSVKRSDDRWTVEMMIPFKTLRFKDNAQEWGINFARNDVIRNEQSSWSPVPQGYSVSSLGFTGRLTFETPLSKNGTNIALIPYLTGGLNERYLEGTSNTTGNAGFDAKIGVTPSLNLDLTVNPDFSQVEVDQQVTNLDRFEIFFPERRQFFIENSDLFGRFGFSRIRPFFSRRIGIGRDTTTGQIVQNPILYGARLSGKVNRDWRIGAMNLQTAQNNEKGIEGQNFTVAAVQRQLFARSNVSAMFVNRQTFGDTTDNAFTRVMAVDYNHLSKDTKWRAKVFYHRAFKPYKTQDAHTHAAYIRYQDRKYNIWWNHEYVGEDYEINDVGFVRRKGLFRFEPFANIHFYPKKDGNIFRHSLWMYFNVYTDLDFNITDRNTELSYTVTTFNRSSVSLTWRNDYVFLFFPFDPTNTGGLRLEEGSEFTYNSLRLRFDSDERKPFFYSGSVQYGNYFNGKRWNISGSAAYRFQPYGQVSLNVTYNDIQLPDPYNDAELWLIAPRLDVSFTRSLFWTTFFQYNNQSENININTRLQWRFRPVSDLFIVYTDNYFPETLRVKNRAVVLKLSYWLNM